VDELRKLLVILGVAGAIGFGAALAASFVQPAAVESLAREIVRAQVEKRGLPRHVEKFVDEKRVTRLTRKFRVVTGATAALFAFLAGAAMRRTLAGGDRGPRVAASSRKSRGDPDAQAAPELRMLRP
jgi:hypothetical protein